MAVVSPRAGRDEHRDSPRALIVWAVMVVAATVVGLAALYAVRHVLVLIYVCALLAIGLSPPVRWIERRREFAVQGRRPPRWAVILVLYTAVLAVVAGVALLITPPLVAQARDLVASGPQLLDRTQTFLYDHGVRGVELGSWLPSGSQTDKVVGTVLGTVSGFLGGVFGAVTILILTFYFLVEGDGLRDRWLRLLPAHRRPRAGAIAEAVTVKVSAWLLAQLILSAVIGTTAWIALVLLGVPFPYVLAIVTAIGELVPFAGPFIAGAIATGIATVTVSWHVGLATAGYFVVQQLLESNVFQPKLMSHQVGLSAATVIVAVLIGAGLLGVLGAVLAVPTAAIIAATVHELSASRPS